MSAFITLSTPMTDQDCLLGALEELGFGADKVEVHAVGAALVGYEGRRRRQQAHIVIRRRHVGAASNDLGFERTSTGFRVHVSDYDHPRFGGGWLARLAEAYQKQYREKLARLAQQELLQMEADRRRLVEAQRQAIQQNAQSMGYRVRETRHGDKLRLMLVKRAFWTKFQPIRSTSSRSRCASWTNPYAGSPLTPAPAPLACVGGERRPRNTSEPIAELARCRDRRHGLHLGDDADGSVRVAANRTYAAFTSAAGRSAHRACRRSTPAAGPRASPGRRECGPTDRHDSN